MKRLGILGKGSHNYHMVILFAFCFLVFLLLWLALKFRWWGRRCEGITRRRSFGKRQTFLYRETVWKIDIFNRFETASCSHIVSSLFFSSSQILDFLLVRIFFPFFLRFLYFGWLSLAIWCRGVVHDSFGNCLSFYTLIEQYERYTF